VTSAIPALAYSGDIVSFIDEGLGNSSQDGRPSASHHDQRHH
jgi:hypothetical protein